MSKSLLNGLSTIQIVEKLIRHSHCPGKLKMRLGLELPGYKVLQLAQAKFDTRMSPGAIMASVLFIESITSDIRSGSITPQQISNSVKFQSRQYG